MQFSRGLSVSKSNVIASGYVHKFEFRARPAGHSLVGCEVL